MKFYVAVFIFFTTRTVHLELFTNLTTDDFLAAFAPFAGRGGFVLKVMHSLQCKTLIGAQITTEKQIVEFIKKVSAEVIESSVPQGINWSMGLSCKKL